MNSNEELRTKNEEPAASPLIFVYGTLRRGGSNHFRMDGAKFISAATVRGTLYKVAWYPAVALDPEGDFIAGEIYCASETQLPALDDYEGPEYRRIKTTATDNQGTAIEVWIWEWIGSTHTLTPLPSGDWLNEL